MQTLFAMSEQNTIQWRKAHDINAKHQPSYTPSLANRKLWRIPFCIKKKQDQTDFRQKLSFRAM